MTPCPLCGTFDRLAHPDQPIGIPPGLSPQQKRRAERLVAAELFEHFSIPDWLPLEEILCIKANRTNLETLRDWLRTRGQYSTNQLSAEYAWAVEEWDRPKLKLHSDDEY